MRAEVLEQLNEARSQRQPMGVVTRLADGEQVLLTPEQAAEHALADEIAARFRSAKSGIVETPEGDFFIQIHVPSPRLVIIGAVHISQALAPMAAACNFDVTVIDPRTAFATPERFTGVDLHGDWPEDVLAKRPLDAFTALVAVTHDPKIDDLPLMQALGGGCFYVGALGSRKTHAKRRDRLAQAGVSGDALDRIAAPIGLNIGAANPPEIAVAILAQMIDALRRGGAA